MALLSKEEIAHAKNLADRILEGLNKRIFGQEQLVKMLVVACLAKGHVTSELGGKLSTSEATQAVLDALQI